MPVLILCNDMPRHNLRIFEALWGDFAILYTFRKRLKTKLDLGRGLMGIGKTFQENVFKKLIKVVCSVEKIFQRKILEIFANWL